MARSCTRVARALPWALLLALASDPLQDLRPACRAGGFAPVAPAAPPQPQLTHATPDYAPTYVGLSARGREILAALDRPVPRLEFQEIRLRDALKALAARLGVAVEIDVAALDNLGLDPDVPVSAVAEGVSGRSLLRRLLAPLDLACVVEDDRLLVTDAESAEERLVIASYPLPIGIGAGEIAELLQTVVVSDTWDTVGGPGTVQPLPAVNAVLVSQTFDAHAEIAALLRDTFDIDLAAAAGGGGVPLRVHGVADPARAEALAPRLVELVNAALGATGDPGAEVTAIGGRLLVRSTSRPFQVFAAELIRSLDGPPAGDADGPNEAAATGIRHPQPNLRHATETYAATFPGLSVADRGVLDALETALPPGGLHLDPDRDTPRTLAAWVTQTYDLPVRIDLRALEDAGLAAHAPIGGHADSLPLGAALERILPAFDLGFTVDDAGITITTAEEAASRLLVAAYPLPTQADGAALADVLHATIAAETWDTVGGSGSIRPLPAANCLVVAQTISVHRTLHGFLRDGFDADLAPPAAEAPPGGVPIRIHALRDRGLLPRLEADLTAICNAALGPGGDPDARVTAVDGRLVVASRSRPFQIFAAEVIRGLDGIEVPAWHADPAFGGMGGVGGGMGMGGPGAAIPAGAQPAAAPER